MGMDGENKSGFIRLVLVSCAIIVFTLIATTAIVTAVPILPAAVVPDMPRDQNQDQTGDLLAYVALHQSWRYATAPYPSQAFDCAP